MLKNELRGRWDKCFSPCKSLFASFQTRHAGFKFDVHGIIKDVQEVNGGVDDVRIGVDESNARVQK